MTASRLLIGGAAVMTLSAAPLGAQQIADMRVGVTPRLAPALGSPSVTGVAVASTRQRPRRWPYVLGGAVVGGAAGGIWVARRAARTDDAMLFPIFVAVPVALGSAAGALGGLMVSAVVDP